MNEQQQQQRDLLMVQMFVARKFRRHFFKKLSSLPIKSLQQSTINCEEGFLSFSSLNHPFNFGWGLCRGMSTSKGRSMKSRVERQMQKETGKTLKEIRRAKKLKKKLMTEEERALHNLKSATCVSDRALGGQEISTSQLLMWWNLG